MQQPNLGSLFPQILHLFQNPLNEDQFEKLSYFHNYQDLLPQKECRSRASKSRKYFKLIKVKKGTVIYNYGDSPEKGYILLSGCIEALSRKNNRQKTETFPGHVLHTPAEKIAYLNKKFQIPKQKAELLINNFYEEKLFFKFLTFSKFYGNNDFGFGQMFRNAFRTQTMIAIQDSELLTIQKQNFDNTLRDFHNKKETVLLQKMTQNVRGQWQVDLRMKLRQVLNSSCLFHFHNEQNLMQAGDYPNSLFYIVSGEIELRKKVILQIPKKYIKQGQTKGQTEKQTTMKISRVGTGNLIGEYEILNMKKQRQFSMVSVLNNCLIFKIDHTSFLRAIGDFPLYEKQLVTNSKQKIFLAKQKYEQQAKKIQKSFFIQYENFQNKKKQKILSSYLNDDYSEKNQMFEGFAPEGVFYRDTFEKLQGFDLAQKGPPKKQSIKRCKSRDIGKNMFKVKEKSEIKIQTPSQALYSPKRNVSPVDFVDKTQIHKKVMEKQENKKRVSSKEEKQFQKHYKSLGKFQEIKKDEAIFKRVLIKYGQYPKDKRIDKSKSVKPMVHKNFDEIISDCITRKNQIIKRTDPEKQKQIIIESYHKTVQVLNKRGSSALISKFSRYTTPCKGTLQMKKKMQSNHINQSAKTPEGSKIFRMASGLQKLENCLGVNQKPKSSQIVRRMQISSSRVYQPNSPQKIVLLNHMMKPITYFNSSQL